VWGSSPQNACVKANAPWAMVEMPLVTPDDIFTILPLQGGLRAGKRHTRDPSGD
jgi:hypothetical protein